MPDIIYPFSKMIDNELVSHIYKKNSAATLELTRRYCKFIGIIIKRINRDWINDDVLLEATNKVVELIIIDIQNNHSLHSVPLKSMIQQTSEKIAIVLWRDAHTENNGSQL